jgi:hypothetical protein
MGSVLFYVWFFNRSNLRCCINCASVIFCLKFCTVARFMLLVVTRGRHYKHCMVSSFSIHILWNSICWFRICRLGEQHWLSCTYIFSTMPAVTFRIGNVVWLNFCCYRSQVKSVRCNFKSLYHYLSWHVNNFLKSIF